MKNIKSVILLSLLCYINNAHSSFAQKLVPQVKTHGPNLFEKALDIYNNDEELKKKKMANDIKEGIIAAHQVENDKNNTHQKPQSTIPTKGNNSNYFLKEFNEMDLKNITEKALIESFTGGNTLSMIDKDKFIESFTKKLMTNVIGMDTNGMDTKKEKEVISNQNLATLEKMKNKIATEALLKNNNKQANKNDVNHRDVNHLNELSKSSFF